MYMYFSYMYMYLVIISFIYCLHVLSITVYLNLLLYYYIWTFTNISPPSGVGPKFFSLKCITVCKNAKHFDYNHCKINTFTCFAHRDANNLNDTSHLPHLAVSFHLLFYTSCELTEGSSCHNYV